MTTSSHLSDFNQIKNNQKELPNQFFLTLQKMLKETQAEFIFLSTGYSDYDYIIESCLIGYDSYDKLINEDEFEQTCINNTEWHLERFREKDSSLVEEYYPVWDKILAAVEDTDEYNKLKAIYALYHENFYDETITNFIQNESNGSILITKTNISFL